MPNTSCRLDPSDLDQWLNVVADDRTLLAQIGQRDEDAMRTFFERFSGKVFSTLFYVLRDSGEAEDVMQEIFLQVWRNPGAFEMDRGSLGAWLVVVARNRAIDKLRKRKPTESLEDVVLVSATNMTQIVERNVLMDRVRKVLGELPEVQRESLELAYLEELTQSEIASWTGLPLGTVKTRIRTGLARLKEAFGVEGIASSPSALTESLEAI